MTIINKEFTYACPDAQYALNTNSSASAIYNGVSKWYVFVDSDGNFGKHGLKLTEQDNGADINPPEGFTKVLVDAEIDTNIASIIDSSGVTLVTPQQTINETITLADADSTVVTHTYLWPQMLHEIIDYDSLVYDTESSSWSYNFKDGGITWDDVIQTRNGMLENSDSRIADDMPEALKTAWIAYRKQLRDLPSDWAGIDAVKVIFPTEPGQ